MKKLLLLLLATSIGYAQVPADATPLENIQITNNVTSTTAAKVVVQESTGVLNTKPLDATVVQSSINPITGGAVYTGLAGKFNTPSGLTTNYLPKWNGSGFGNSVIQENSSRVTINKTWNGTSNFPLDIRGFNGAGESVIRTETFEDTSYEIEMYSKYDNSNKAGLRNATGNIIKQNISGDVILGISNNTFVDASGYLSTIPAVNSNQVVVKSQLDAFVPSTTVNLTGDQSITGQKTFNNTTASNSIFNTNSGTGSGIRVDNSATGTGNGILVNNNGTNSGVSVQNNSASGAGLSVQNNSTGSGAGLRIINVSTGTGAGVLVTSGTSNTGFNYVGQNNGTTTFSVNKTGDITGNSLKLNTLNTAPATATSAGTLGEIRVTSTHIYVCTATNTWVRSALTTW